MVLYEVLNEAMAMNTDAMLSPVKDLIHGRKGMEPTCVEIDHPTLEDVSDDVGGLFSELFEEV